MENLLNYRIYRLTDATYTLNYIHLIRAENRKAAGEAFKLTKFYLTHSKEHKYYIFDIDYINSGKLI